MPRNKGSPYKVYIDIEFAIALYSTGNYTLRDLGKLFGVGTSTMYYQLNNVGCEFIKTWRKEMSSSERLRRSISGKGKSTLPWWK